MSDDYDRHLAWCKERALKYLENGDLAQAVTSMLMDLSKHSDGKAIADKMGPVGLMHVMNYDCAAVRLFIEGFR